MVRRDVKKKMLKKHKKGREGNSDHEMENKRNLDRPSSFPNGMRFQGSS